MVSVIKTGYSIQRILNYNENKVKEGVAECISAVNYAVDHDKMSFNMKLKRFEKQLELREIVKRNSVHISLNFDPSESHLSREKLQQIADQYMEKIGFGNQPYLVYQHHDAGHPHIHIVSIKIDADGNKIDMNNIGKNQSEIARKSIEKDFGLIQAEAQHTSTLFQLKPVSVPEVIYGKIQTKRAIQNVLQHVMESYKFTSLPELNAVLKQYNVSAEKGSENSRILKYNGLLYRILDAKGIPVGVPIKASRFYNRPTLKFLADKFSENEPKRTPHKSKLKTAIDLSLLEKDSNIHKMISVLEKQGIAVMLRQNSDGMIYGITYVDHRTKCVFNGSVLGKKYSAKAILDHLSNKENPKEARTPISQSQQTHNQPEVAKTSSDFSNDLNTVGALHSGSGFGGLLETLLEPEYNSDQVPYELTGKKRRKKRRRKSKNQ